MAEGRVLFQVYPHDILFPGIFLALTVLAVNVLGDGLRDTLDRASRGASSAVHDPTQGRPSAGHPSPTLDLCHQTRLGPASHSSWRHARTYAISLYLENWRNFTKVDVVLQYRVFIAGPNASGKSNCWMRCASYRISPRRGRPSKCRSEKSQRSFEDSVPCGASLFRSGS